MGEKSRAKSKVGSARVITCSYPGQEQRAVIVDYDNGSVEVRCDAGCYPCKHGKLVEAVGVISNKEKQGKI